MKYLLYFSFLMFSLNIQAQVQEKTSSLSLGDQMAFVMEHQDADKKTVEKIIEKKLKQYGKVKRNKKAKEWACDQCEISMIDNQPISVYYKVEEKQGMIATYTFFDDGTKFLCTENDQAAGLAITKFNLEIYHDVSRAVITEELKNEEKNLKGFGKDLSKLGKEEEDLHKDIEKFKQKIKDAEKEIEENLIKQEEKRMQIAKQESLIDSVKDKLNKVGSEK